jgi:two-component system, cell cycle response regulator
MSAGRILVVDDNPTNLKLASDVLEAEGYEILKAADAEEAQLVIERNPPELILMDIALPGMDGLTLTRILKSSAKTRHIVIVALTAFAMKGDDAKAYAAGCNGYITKPIDTFRLPQQVAGFLCGIMGSVPATELRVLVIEDDPPQLKLANGVLSADGHLVTEAKTAEAALSIIKRDRPDVILLDLCLPGMDGLTLVRMLKLDPGTLNVPVVAVTAFPEKFTRAAALEAGCDAYLTKPIDTGNLAQQIKDAVVRAEVKRKLTEAS